MNRPSHASGGSSATNTGRIVRVTFTSEPPEHWQAITVTRCRI